MGINPWDCKPMGGNDGSPGDVLEIKSDMTWVGFHDKQRRKINEIICKIRPNWDCLPLLVTEPVRLTNGNNYPKRIL